MLSAVMIPYKISVYKNQYNSNRFYNITYRRINQLFFCENNTNIAKHHTHICIFFHNRLQYLVSIFICKKALFAIYSKNIRRLYGNALRYYAIIQKDAVWFWLFLSNFNKCRLILRRFLTEARGRRAVSSATRMLRRRRKRVWCP